MKLLLCVLFFQLGYAEKSKLEVANMRHEQYLKDLQNLDWEKVKTTINKMLTTSDPKWPADYGNYGPLFIRLAWHSAGSYRTSDGRGGVDGARQRFDPERSWADNTNLDKARNLLWSVKQEFPQVSWGDLIVLAGNEALRSMGAPVFGFCAGRVDDDDGSDSILLGPSPEQDLYAPCVVNGTCTAPLGSTTVGLIYVNPQGPMGEPDARGSAPQVRDTFARMDMNDSETVALIGGGHAFGKAHGACPFGAGSSPAQDPQNPWPGECGTGKGMDTYTSGIEGSWTTNPTTWDNEYFQNLIHLDWSPHKGPGDAWQFATIDSEDNPMAPAADMKNKSQATMMMTTDISLKNDDKFYDLVQQYAKDLNFLNDVFSYAWYKLTTRDMGPYSRCAPNSPSLPPPQNFQHPLPKQQSITPQTIEQVRNALILEFIAKEQSRALAINFAYACASTFRQTDYLGGCNGARILYPPATQWQGYSKLVQDGTALLEPVQTKFKNISWADLIVLAGGVALEISSNNSLHLDFCGGRTDDSEGSAWKYLEPTIYGNVNETADMLKETILRTGLSNTDFVALLGARRSIGNATFPFYGVFSSNPAVLDNTYFQNLLASDFELITAPSGSLQYKSVDNDIYATQTDISVKFDAELGAIVQRFATNNSDFLSSLTCAWPKLMNADRFDMPHCLPGTTSSTSLLSFSSTFSNTMTTTTE